MAQVLSPGAPVREQVTLAEVTTGPEEERLVLEVLRSGYLAQGPMVARLEEGFAALTETTEAVAVSSGTTALVAALQALGVGPGDDVVTSPVTFGATLNAILQVGARARFVDVLPDGTMDPDALDEALDRPAKAIIPVHLFGYAADMEGIADAAWSAGATIVEDAAQAAGARYRDRPAGSYGIGCFSLYATKNITAGEGGMVTTDDPRIADHIRLLRGQGMRARYQYEIVGHNYRMTDLQAAVGVAQLARIDELNGARRANAGFLSEGLAGLPGITIPRPEVGRGHVFHQYTITVGPDAPISRDELADRLAERGIQTGVVYPRVVFDYPCYLEHPLVEVAGVPTARRLVGEVLSLPVHPGLSRTDIDRIVDAVRAALGF